jgi:hypothetical protein
MRQNLVGSGLNSAPQLNYLAWRAVLSAGHHPAGFSKEKLRFIAAA